MLSEFALSARLSSPPEGDIIPDWQLAIFSKSNDETRYAHLMYKDDKINISLLPDNIWKMLSNNLTSN